MLYSTDMSQLRMVSPLAAHFLAARVTATLPDGRYEIGGGAYAIVERYATRSRDAGLYESHRHYADIQIVIEGEETVEVAPAAGLEIQKAYAEAEDIAFYRNETVGESCRLTPGRFLVLSPEDGHMPCLSPKGLSAPVIKIVFKLPIGDAASPSADLPMPRVKALVMDVDGTLTDGKVFMGPGGESMKAFDVKDGLGIRESLPGAGITPVVITGRSSETLSLRCSELGIADVFQGIVAKPLKLREYLQSKGFSFGEAAYIGDDLNDLECMRLVHAGGGIVGCPSDAVMEVVAGADYVASRSGGNGAVREFIDFLIEGRIS